MKELPIDITKDLVSFAFRKGSYYDGFILATNVQGTLICLINDDGVFDGIAFVRTNAINYVECQSEYCRQLQKICGNVPHIDTLFYDNEDLLLALLTYAKRQQLLSTIGLGLDLTSDQYGLISHIANDKVYLNLYTNDGEKNGIGEIYLNKINFIRCEPKCSESKCSNQKFDEESSLNEILQQSLLCGDMIGVFSDTEDKEAFTAGFVIALNQTEFILARVLTNGKYDGYSVYQIKQIQQLEAQTSYLNYLSKQYENAEFHHAIFNYTDNFVKDLLMFAYTNTKIISLEIEDSGYKDVYGIVKIIQNSLLKIELITHGKSDGFVYTEIDKITKIMCDTQDD